MRLAVFAALLGALAAVPASSQSQGDSTPPAPATPLRPGTVPFGTGERQVYIARFQGITVGEGSMEVLGTEDVRGTVAWHTRFKLKGDFLWFHARYLLESWFGVDSGNSLRFIQDADDEGRSPDRHYEIFPERRMYREGEKPEQPSIENPLDEGAFMYFVRTQELEVGKTYEYHRYFRPDRNPVIVKVIRKERLSVAAGTFNTILIQPIIKSKGIFSENGQAQLWLTDDKDRIMVQMKARLKFGSVSLYLKSVTPPTK